MASTIKVDTIDTPSGSGSIAFSQPQTGLSASPRKNIIINGAMQVAQRGTSATGQTGSGYQTCDRWHEYNTGNSGTFTYTQETLTSGDAYANGFQKAYRVDCTTAVASPPASVQHYVRQKFEGQDVQGFKKGTANAESYTLSFWVKSNQTGTGICALNDHDNSRYIGGTYTISSANTWEKKTITFASDATGIMANDNGVSLDVRWWLGAGTDFTSGTLPSAWESGTNAIKAVGNAITVGTSTSNDWAITGVKLEVGSSATDFEHRSYGEELALCQRYYNEIIIEGASATGAASNCDFSVSFNPFMRTAPTLSQTGVITVTSAAADHTQSSTGVSIISSVNNERGVRLRLSNLSSLTQFRPYCMTDNTDFITLDAEL